MDKEDSGPVKNIKPSVAGIERLSVLQQEQRSLERGGHPKGIFQ